MCSNKSCVVQDKQEQQHYSKVMITRSLLTRSRLYSVITKWVAQPKDRQTRHDLSISPLLGPNVR
jgi:hypothetical protein